MSICSLLIIYIRLLLSLLDVCFDESLSRLYQHKSQNKQKDKYQLLLFQRDVPMFSSLLFRSLLHNYPQQGGNNMSSVGYPSVVDVREYEKIERKEIKVTVVRIVSNNN